MLVCFFSRYHRSIKKNNFFLPAGTRLGEEHPDLRVENSHKSKTITLQLQTNGEHNKQKPPSTVATSTFIQPTAPFAPPATAYLGHKPSKHSHDKLYRSATSLSPSAVKMSRPLFYNVNAYLNLSNKRSPLYSSDQYLDSSRVEGPLRPLDNQMKRPVSKKLVAKYSDMEIQKELKDFFKVRSVK